MSGRALRWASLMLLLHWTYAQQPAPAPAPDAVMKVIALRQEENARRMNSPQLARDMERAHVSAQQIEWMRRKLCPLGFKNPDQYQEFRRELQEVLRATELKDVHVGLAGTASAFYSENPRKPSGHFFDENPAEPADIDFNLAGPAILQQLQAAGKKPHPTISDIYRNRDVFDAFPKLRELAEKWSRVLQREVSFVTMTGLHPWRSPTEYVVVQGAE
jgi:hypothetical protein